MHVEHLIIGAGPTGLGAAWRLEQRGSRDWLILEAGEVAGGFARSVVDEHGFTWDLGGHQQVSHCEMFDELMDELLGPDGWLCHERECWVWTRGRFVPCPLQLRLHGLPSSDAGQHRFRFPRRGGTGAVWQALARRLTARDAAGAGRIRFRTAVKHVDTAARRLALSDGTEITCGVLISTMPIDRLIASSDLARDLRAATRDLEYSSTHVVGVGLHGAPPASLANKCRIYFPEGDCPFYRVTHFSRYSPNNVADPATQWSLLVEISESPRAAADRARLVNDVIEGLVATSLIESPDQVHHTWHTRLEHGCPVPSLRRDRALSGILSTLDARRVFSRGRFGAWKYEVSNRDHSFAQGVEVVDALL